MRALLAWQKIEPDVDNRKNDRYSLLIYGNSLIYSCFFNAGSYDHNFFWMERVTKIIGKKVEISCNQDKRLNTTTICGNKACAIIF